MPLFGSDDKKEAREAALRAEVERLAALPLPELAAEIMVKGYGPGGPGAESPPTLHELMKPYDPTGKGLIVMAIDRELGEQLFGLVEEAVQQLEHAGLLVQDSRGLDHLESFRYRPTRAGRVALQSGDVAHRLQAGPTLP
jgi:hypothetical protein